jgi:radical SAM protein with 4Fe4S-binding SPASM domain
MTGTHLSLILLPTLSCNADCDYCFEVKTNDSLTLDRFALLLEKVLAYMNEQAIQKLTIYWQGGEVMMLPPEWYEQAHDVIQEAAVAKDREIDNALQTNLIGYNNKWNRILFQMFGNSLGSSLDYPNLHRKLPGGSPHEFTAIWHRNFQVAKEAGIDIGVISIPNPETFKVGAERFYSYFVDDLGITNFQINTPFPGGPITETKKTYPLETDQLTKFLLDLADIWFKNGYRNGVKVGPFDELIKYFIEGDAQLPCIWRDNCVNELVSIDPNGNVAQCDCWVASYPEFRFGNIFSLNSFSNLLKNSEARQRLQSRPRFLIQQEDCLECDYLAICHGGCPIRTYSNTGNLFTKDPYCHTYKSLFSYMEQHAAKLAQSRISGYPKAKKSSLSDIKR